MMNLENKNIGIGITGSFCTFDKIIDEIENLVEVGAHVIPIFSFHAATMDTRFAKAKEFVQKVEQITKQKAILTIEDAEPLGPKGLLDIMAIAPCTGNTIAKLSHSITDTPVLMAAKAHMRNNKPLVISISTNDALGLNLKNIGQLLSTKEVYFVPFGQDNVNEKPKSMIAHVELLSKTIQMALEKTQLQPVLREYE